MREGHVKRKNAVSIIRRGRKSKGQNLMFFEKRLHILFHLLVRWQLLACILFRSNPRVLRGYCLQYYMHLIRHNYVAGATFLVVYAKFQQHSKVGRSSRKATKKK